MFRRKPDTEHRFRYRLKTSQQMSTKLGFVLGFVAVVSLLGQSSLWTKSPLARRGLHHSNVSGRFVDQTGKAVPGIRVQLTGAGPRQLPATDSDYWVQPSWPISFR